jgi:hypothetical protein
VWKLDFTRFPFAKSHFVSVFYHAVRGVPYVRLFDPFGTDLEGFDCGGADASGFFRALAPGRHSARVVAGDPWNNTDEIEVPFAYGLAPAFEVCGLEDSGPRVAFQVSAADDGDSLDVSFRAGGGAWRRAEAERRGRAWTGTLSRDALAPAAGNESSGVEVLFKLSGQSGLTRECVLGTAGSGEATAMEAEVRPDCVVIRVHTPCPPRSLPSAEVREGKSRRSVLLEPVARNTFRGCYYPGETAGGVEVSARLEFAAIGVERTLSLPVEILKRGRDVSIAGPRFSAVLSECGRGSMETLLLATPKEATVCDGFSGSEGTVVFEPADVFFENGIEVSVWSDETALTDRHGLYSMASVRPSLIKAFDSQGRCRAKIWRLDPLAVLEDSAAPSVGMAGTASRKRDGTVVFSGKAHDPGSGIDSGSIRASIDGEAAIASYDPDTGAISVRSTKPLPLGRHRLRLEAQDRIGNLGSVEVERDLP